jgi:nucleotide-binding universal stress UspA family protein
VVTGAAVVDPVVVGVDGSPGSLAAVLVAAAEAALRQRPLRVVHGTKESDAPSGVAPDELLAEAIATARDAVPGLAVDGEVVTGRPADVLTEESRHAPLVVIGDRGLNRLAELVAGAMGVHLAAHASCPVLVVRGDPARAGDVLLGVDDDPRANDPAIEFAFQEAALHGAAITALHASTHRGDSAERDPAEPAGPMGRALAGWRERYPDVPVRLSIVHDDTRDALIEASGSARLAVVGAGDRGELAGLLFGSVSTALLHHADCPLAIVRGTASAGEA